jgi:ABC-type sugar transport system ATPase subunit
MMMRDADTPPNVDAAANAGAAQQPVLVAHGLTKRFGRVTALDGVDVELMSGQIVALVGDNGAGKSTLVSILSGVAHPDTGSIFVDGKPAWLDSPAKAHELGIVTVFQDLALVNERDVAANIYLGREPTWLGVVVNRQRMIREATEVIASLRVGLPSVRTPVSRLSGGQRQAVAVARAIVRGISRVVMMDEPTAALGVREAAQVAEVIRGLRAQGRAVLLISHNIDSVFDLADRVIVLRLGRKVADRSIAATTRDEIVSLIVRGEGGTEA